MSSSRCFELADGGELRLWPAWLCDDDADALFRELRAAAPWTQGHVTMFGKRVPEPRISAWVGDPGTVYRYSGRTNEPAPWPAGLRSLRRRLEEFVDARFNSALLNLYRDEKDSMGWHADDERELGVNPLIASLSLGQSRRFWLKHPRAPTVRLTLEHGSLLVMSGTTQHHWKHSVPKERQPRRPRINVTFRYVMPR